MRVDSIYLNANFITMDELRPRAQAVATLGDRIVAVGDIDDLSGLSPRRTVDLSGATVVPGFNDAHNHTLRLGMMLDELNLESPPVRRLEDILDMISTRAATVPEGSWIIGCRYDQNKLLEGRHPTADELTRIAPRHHVWLKHTSLHMAVVSRSVLDLIDVDETVVPGGGWVERDETGRATGLLLENAQQLVAQLKFPHSIDSVTSAIARAGKQYASEGITSCQEAGIGAGLATANPQELAAFSRSRDKGELLTRTTLMVAVDALRNLAGHDSDLIDLGLDLGISSGLGDDTLRIGAVKIWADGSLVGRTAAMNEPFAEDGDNVGYFLHEPEELFHLIRRVHRGGWQVATHAIGDRAVGAVLDIYDKVLRETPRTDHRHRIEHCAVVDPLQLKRIRNLGVIPVPQGRFVNELGDGMADALGPERVAWCYRQRSFLDEGIVVPGSSDRPVVNGAPLRGIADMVLRRTSSGQSFNERECVSAEDALRAWTVGSAYASFEERLKGRLRPGMLADMTVLSKDILSIPTEQIPETEVVQTLLGGVATYSA
ncbi:amidohydrolase [Rhodococcus opacus]|nr:amidohydrolase [Rhodococcus opacus]